MRYRFLAILALLPICACDVIPNKQINTIAKADATWALADAKAHNDTNLVPCYQAVYDNSTADLASGPAPAGILSSLQVARDECANLQKILTACAPVAASAPLVYSTVVTATASACKAVP